MKIFIYPFLLLFTFSLGAQTPFWTENFANGIPSAWTNADASNQNVLWTWCSDPASNGGEPGCPLIWSDGSNSQIPFQATTAENGFATLDSDEAGELAADHISELTTSAINCADKNQVFLRFQTQLGTYTYDADDKAILRVSTDLVNWTSYQVFSGLTTTIRWSANPAIPIIDISATAATQSTVYIQWQWTGNYEYLWNIDDVEVYGENPTPRHDLALGDVFFPLSSYASPASEIQTDTCAFYAYVSNNGLLGQHNVQLKAWITDSNNSILFADSTIIGTLPVGYKDSLMVIPSLYAPEVAEGIYSLHYQVSADSTDGRIADNSHVSNFVATSSYFAKEDGPEQYYRPNTLTDPWYVANYYRMSKKSLEKYKAVSIDFAHTTNADEIAINAVSAGAYLMRVNDDIDDNLDNLNDADFFASFAWLGIGDYVAVDTVADDGGIRTVELFDLSSGEPGIAIETGARYLAAISYAGSNKQVFQAYNNDNKYFFTSTLQYGGGSFYSFGEDVNAVVRLNLSLLTTSDEVALPETAMLVFPNPVIDQVNLGIKMEQEGPATVTIADISGRIILTQDYDHLHQEVLSYKLPKLAPGIYIARIATEKGTLTKRFNKI
jgi:hypothetical protein